MNGSRRDVTPAHRGEEEKFHVKAIWFLKCTLQNRRFAKARDDYQDLQSQLDSTDFKA
jgi:hypothetical protein